VNDDACADAEVVLSAIEEASRIVVNLYRANIESAARTNIQTTSERSSQTGVSFGKVCARRRKYCHANGIAEINLVASVRHADQRLGERFEARLRRIIFDLYAPQKIVERRVDIDLRGPYRNGPALEVSCQINLQADITRDVAGDGSVEAIETFAVADDVVPAAGINAIVLIPAVEFPLFVVVSRLRERNRSAGCDQNCQ